MKIALATLFLLGCALAAANAQSTQQSAFEVASVKPSAAVEPGTAGAGITQDPSLLSIKRVPLKAILMRAYGLKAFQIEGPDWLETQFYDINAKLPAGATTDQVPVMLQRLLTERLQMTIRWDTKQETGYALVVDKGGPRLTPSADQSTQDGDRPDKARSLSMGSTVRMQGAPTAGLAYFLSGVLSEPVVDSTGLQGRYDITLNLSFQQLTAARQGPSASASDDSGYSPSVLFDAVRDLGLRLQPQKVEVKHLTVVKADRIPTEN